MINLSTSTVTKSAMHGTPQEHKRSSLFEAIILLVVVVLFGWFLLKPKNQSLSEQKSQADILASQAASTAEAKADLEKLVSQMRSNTADVALLDEALPLQSRLSKVEVVLEQYIRDSGLQLSNISVDIPETGVAAADSSLAKNQFEGKRKLQTTPFTVTASGTMQQLRAFLLLLENGGRIIDVAGVEVASQTDSLTFRIKVKSYAYAPEPKAEKKEAPVNE
jgi:Tfp pilus assembly protein PilO